jgi:hypothetical protein
MNVNKPSIFRFDDVEVRKGSSPSRRQFLYFRRISGDPGAFRISIRGGAPEKIVDLKDWQDAGWLGFYMGLDPTDAPLMLRDIGSEDIYALTLDSK